MNRTDWGKRNHNCFVCGAIRGLETHEVARGIHRSQAVKEPCAWLRLCGKCHTEIHKHPLEWTIVRQLAVKLIHDPEHYDRRQVCRIRSIRDQLPDMVTEQEVARLVNDTIRRGLIWLPN